MVDPPGGRLLDEAGKIRRIAGDIALSVFGGIFTGCIIIMVLQAFINSRAAPHFFLRIVGVEGLDPSAASSPTADADHVAPPAFRLAIDVAGVREGYAACVGGNCPSMLRVSFHGMVLAWGAVPPFCIDGKQLRQQGRDGAADGVAAVYARAESAVLREELHGMIRSEQHIMGKVNFDVDGYVARLGYLRCKTHFFEGEQSPLYSCEVRKAYIY
uniref:Uncharacterized protein n=2 Tax=Oryza brachyantha TaxID=4533 RepID=J3L2G2_ORYBR